MRPEVLLLDEVTSALDPELVGDVLEMLRDLARRGLTMVIVTHHIEFARDVADWVVMLEKGEIIERGPASEMLSVPEHERTMRFIRAVSSAR
jgi:polar amino acid transport system ATP-binding protein